MKRIKLHDKTFEKMLSHAELQRAISAVAAQLNRDYGVPTTCSRSATAFPENGSTYPLFLGVLNGSFMFAAELLQKIDFQCEISFVKIASYCGTQSGESRVLIGLNQDLSGRDVIVVEDIVESGNTIERLRGLLRECHPRSIRIVTLFFKPEVYQKEFPIDYFALRISSDFIVGFGLDYDGLGRNLKDIYSCVEEGILE